MSNAIYEERAVLFLDILGFKVLIESGQEQKIFTALGTSAAFANGKPSFPELTHTTAFSDSIVVSHRLKPAGVQNIINTASMLAWCFLQQGILIRGGIAYGNMHHTNDRLFGHAMNNAYQLESKLAIFPRIVVSEEFRALACPESSDATNIGIGNCDPEVLRQDFDGQWHIDLMSHLTLSPFITFTNKEELFARKAETIKSALDNPSPPYGKDKSAKAKHDWLANYLHASVKNGPSQNPKPIVR